MTFCDWLLYGTCVKTSSVLQHVSIIHSFLRQIIFHHKDILDSASPSSGDEHLGSFHFSTAVSHAVMNIHGQVFIDTYFQFSPRRGIAESLGTSVYNFVKNCQVLFLGAAFRKDPPCLDLTFSLAKEGHWQRQGKRGESDHLRSCALTHKPSGIPSLQQSRLHLTESHHAVSATLHDTFPPHYVSFAHRLLHSLCFEPRYPLSPSVLHWLGGIWSQRSRGASLHWERIQLRLRYPLISPVI